MLMIEGTGARARQGAGGARARQASEDVGMRHAGAKAKYVKAKVEAEIGSVSDLYPLIKYSFCNCIRVKYSKNQLLDLSVKII